MSAGALKVRRRCRRSPTAPRQRKAPWGFNLGDVDCQRCVAWQERRSPGTFTGRLGSVRERRNAGNVTLAARRAPPPPAPHPGLRHQGGRAGREAPRSFSSRRPASDDSAPPRRSPRAAARLQGGRAPANMVRRGWRGRGEQAWQRWHRAGLQGAGRLVSAAGATLPPPCAPRPFPAGAPPRALGGGARAASCPGAPPGQPHSPASRGAARERLLR